MNSELLHTIFPIFKPFGLYVFLTVICISLITAGVSWLLQKNQIVDIGKYFPKLEENFPIIFLITGLCLSTIPVFICWSTACFYQNNLGGLYPIMDAEMYYNGAEKLLLFGKLDAWDQHRPLHVCFLAFRQLITNFDYRLTLIIQALFFGLSAFLASLAVSRTLGKIAGIIFFGSLLAFSTFYLPENLTESLGITLGCLSFALIWLGGLEKKKSAFFLGLFFLILALMARAGPMLVIPAIIVYSGFAFRENGTYNKTVAIFSLFLSGFGVLLNQCIIWLFGDGTGVAFGNYATVLYGLASGGKGWEQYKLDFPYQAQNLKFGELDKFLYQKAGELIIQNPLQFVNAILKGFISEPLRGIDQLYIFLTEFEHQSYFNVNAFYFICVLLLIGVFLFFKISRNTNLFYLLLSIILGTFFTLPFYFVDGGIRTLAAIFPYMALAVVIGSIGWRHPLWIPQKIKYSQSDSVFAFILPSVIGLFIILAIILTLIVGPVFYNIYFSPPRNIDSLVCQGNETNFAMRIDTGMPFIDIMDKSDNRHTFAPYERSEDFVGSLRANATYHYYYDFGTFPDNENFPQLLLGYDLRSNASYYILAPRNFIGDERRYLNVCAKSTNMSGLINPAFEINNQSIILISKG
jgi:uncharacterized membrane protein